MAHEQPHETTQSFWEHLEALRWAILRSLGVLLVAMVGFFAAMPWLFDHLILAPTHGDFLLYRWIARLAGGEFAVSYQQFDVELINIRVASQFMTHISTSFWCALVATFPYLIYEIWRFVRPALYRAERRAVAAAFSTGTALFFAGCAVGYLVVFPIMFRFLADYQLSAEIANQIALHSYMGNFLGTIFMMGIAFELPILTWLISRIGLVTREQLKYYRRHAVVILLIAAALITPSGDPFTLMVVFLPLYLLYEAGICFARPAEREP